MPISVTVRRRAVLVLTSTVALGVVAVALAGAAADAVDALRGPGPARLDDAVLAAAATAGAALAGWLAAGTVVSVAALLGGARDRRVLPAPLHRLVAVALGVALAGVSAPAFAAVPHPPGAVAAPAVPQAAAPAVPQAAAPAVAAAVDPGWTPPTPPPAVRQAAPADPVLVPPPRAGLHEQDAVAVRRGDTLWDIAARYLPPGATDADIAAAWPRWHAENAAVIGADPDLLLPGQLLRVPAAAG